MLTPNEAARQARIQEQLKSNDKDHRFKAFCTRPDTGSIPTDWIQGAFDRG